MFDTFKNISILLAFIHLFWADDSLAQVIPDDSLGNDKSQVEIIDNIEVKVQGGLTSKNNLFHSWEKFDVPDGQIVNFDNPGEIVNILNRVTGDNISKILGTLRANGNANLFLLNPNGIIFGANTTLDIGGSFMATTAEAMNFAEDISFSATTQDIPLGANGLPLNLVFGDSVGDISVSGEKNNVYVEIPSFRVVTDDLPVGIQVGSGKNISLLGGTVNFSGGGLKASGGDLEIVSSETNQVINLNKQREWLKTDISEMTQFKNISFQEAAFLDVSDRRAGNISISGKNITLDDGSVIIAKTEFSTDNSISINAAESLTLKGTSNQFGSPEFSFVEINRKAKNLEFSELVGTGNKYSVSLITAEISSTSKSIGNDININTDNLQLLDAANIRTISFANSKAGDINISATNLSAEGDNNIDNFLTSSITSTSGIKTSGSAGNVNIFSKFILLKDGGRITSDTFGSGNGGDINVESQDIIIKGTTTPFLDTKRSAISTFSPGAANSTNFNDSTVSGLIDIKAEKISIFDAGAITSASEGNISAGNIRIRSKSILISGSKQVGPDEFIGSTIAASLDSRGNPNREAGNIILDTDQLKILDGASIRAFSSAGDAGNIAISAKKIELNGTKPRVNNFIGGISSSTTSRAFGNGGNIEIKTDSLKILNGSIIRAISLGTGDGGNIDIQAKDIKISGFDRFAPQPVEPRRISKISAESQKTNGGSVRIKTDLLKLDNLGLLVGTTNGTGRGGELFLDAQTLRLDNGSNIRVNARSGDGGNITIDSDNLIGLNNSDITASAVEGNGGNIRINSNLVLGIAERGGITSFSDITADSELGIDGAVKFNSPEINSESLSSVLSQRVQFYNPFIIALRGCVPYQSERRIFISGRRENLQSPQNNLDYDDDASKAIEMIRQKGKEILSEKDLSSNPGNSILPPTGIYEYQGKVYLLAEKDLQKPEMLVAKSCRQETIRFK